MTEQRLLILGTGHIAGRHAEVFSAIPGCRLVAAVDINRRRAEAYAATHGIARVFDDLDAVLDWGQFDAAVNATPDAMHAPTSLRLIGAGKSVFCEKPLALHEADALVMRDAAEEAGVINMVNLTYRNAHAVQKARLMIDAGAIGEVRHVEASYLQSWLTGSHWGDWKRDERWLWRLSRGHGSNGVLGDIGVHLLDFVSFGTGLDFAGLQARLRIFDKAEGGRIGDYVLDVNDSVVINAELANGALAAIHMSRFATGHANDLNLAIHGTTGALRIWANHTDSTLQACLGADIDSQRWTTLTCPPTPRNEDRFIAALQSGVNGDPSFRAAAAMQRLLDLCMVSDADGCWVAA